MTILKPCLDCGELSQSVRCFKHRPVHAPKASGKARGYDWNWMQLSRRARRIQPWCSICGTTKDLTTDHSTEAWERKEKGLPIRLEDVDVLCRSHNSAKGRARPTGMGADEDTAAPHGKAKFASHTPGGMR